MFFNIFYFIIILICNLIHSSYKFKPVLFIIVEEPECRVDSQCPMRHICVVDRCISKCKFFFFSFCCLILLS